jgi:hypothetical protein
LKSQILLVWTDILNQQFSEFIGVELDLAPKREFVPHDLFYKCANLQKLWRSQSIYFKGPNRANQPNSDFGEISSTFCLTISTFVNSISSSILGYGVCLSPIP